MSYMFKKCMSSRQLCWKLWEKGHNAQVKHGWEGVLRVEALHCVT